MHPLREAESAPTISADPDGSPEVDDHRAVFSAIDTIEEARDAVSSEAAMFGVTEGEFAAGSISSDVLAAEMSDIAAEAAPVEAAGRGTVMVLRPADPSALAAPTAPYDGQGERLEVNGDTIVVIFDPSTGIVRTSVRSWESVATLLDDSFVPFTR